MSGRIEMLTLEDVVGRSTSIVRAAGLGGGSFRVRAVLQGTSKVGDVLQVVTHAAWRAAEWERIFRESGARKIMFYPRYEGTSGASFETSEELLLFLSGGNVLVADGAVEDPAREADVRALIPTDSSPPGA